VLRKAPRPNIEKAVSRFNWQLPLPDPHFKENLLFGGGNQERLFWEELNGPLFSSLSLNADHHHLSE
jgi:hypothetical protein